MKNFAVAALMLFVLIVSDGLAEGKPYLSVPKSIVGFTNAVPEGPQEIRLDQDGKFAYVVSYYGDAFTVFNVLAPGNIEVVGSITGDNRLDYATGVTVSGRYAYAVTHPELGSNMVVVIDIIDPANPYIVGSLSDCGGIGCGGRNLVKDGNYLYVAGYNNNAVFIIDVSDPEYPDFVSLIDKSLDARLGAFKTVYAIDKQDRYVYAVAGSRNAKNEVFAIIDVADPAYPQVKGVYSGDDILNRPVGVLVKGRYAYVTTLYVDFGILPSAYEANDLALRGLSGANGYTPQNLGNSLVVFDVSDPENIIRTGYTQMEKTSERYDGTIVRSLAGAEGILSVDDKYAYVPIWLLFKWDGNKFVTVVKDGENVGGLATVDISDPAKPIVLDLMGGDKCSGQAYKACGYIYCTSFRESSLTIFDATTLPE